MFIAAVSSPSLSFFTSPALNLGGMRAADGTAVLILLLLLDLTGDRLSVLCLSEVSCSGEDVILGYHRHPNLLLLKCTLVVLSGSLLQVEVAKLLHASIE